MTPEELIEAAKNLSYDSDYIDGFEERCRKREEEFKEIKRQMQPDADWYNFMYGVRNK